MRREPARCRQRSSPETADENLTRPALRPRRESRAGAHSVFEQLTALRRRQGMTQKQLARRIGTRQSAISRLESGAYNASLAMLQKVATALDAKLEISLRSLDETEQYDP